MCDYCNPKIWSAIAAAHPLMAWDIQTDEYKSFDI